MKLPEPPTLPADDLTQLNRELFRSYYPHDDPALADLALHLIIGQLPNVLKLRYTIENSPQDLRTHLTVFSPSGTQKGGVLSYIATILDGLSLKMKAMGPFTDSGLIGFPTGTDPDSLETNEIPFRGDLHETSGNSILAWGEATDVFDTKKVGINQNTFSILQKAMNPIGTIDNTIEKTTGLGTVKANPTTSLLLVTYPPFTLTTETISTGLLQRMIVLYRDVSINQRSKISSTAASKINHTTTKASLSSLVSHLESINAFAQDRTFTIPVELEPEISRLSSHIWSFIYEKHIAIQPKLAEFASRWSVNILYNLIFHHCLCRRSTTVSYEDIVYTELLILPVWYDLCNFLEAVIKKDTQEFKQLIQDMTDIALSISSLYPDELANRKPVWIEESALITELRTIWKLSGGGTLAKFRRYSNYLFDTKTEKKIPKHLIDQLHPSELELHPEDFHYTNLLSPRYQTIYSVVLS